MMHAVQVLLEVIQARPLLVRARTVCPEAHVHHLGPSLGLFIVNTFFMTGKIINCAKSVFPRAIWDVAFEKLFVASLMFSMAVNFLHHNAQIITRKTYLLSEGHFPTHLHDGSSHSIEESTDCCGEPTNSGVYDGPETDP